ncbi:MAG TPA: hypothetical protein VKC54_03035 [Patescibacteria group bacterium]|nr:hypothetical protein [Patescibacteria group bacterium]
MISSFWKKLPFKGLVVLGLGLNFAMILLYLIIRGFLPPIIPLLYGRPAGSGQLLPNLGILLAPMLSIVFIFLNIVISNLLTDAFSKKLLIAVSCLISFLTSITLLKIIFLVGFF